MGTMREALKKYFDDNGFGDDGGYAAAWVDFKLGPLPFPLPNSDARRTAVKFHDLNHVLTGYRTDIAGEFEISAWELGAGCRSFLAAWVLNLGGLAAGTVAFPRRTWRAFVAGRRSRGATYALEYEQALAAQVDEVKRQLDIHTEGEARAGDVLLYGLALLGGLASGTLLLAVLLSPLTLVLWWRGRQLRARPAIRLS
jgi:hypothetical protein